MTDVPSNAPSTGTVDIPAATATALNQHKGTLSPLVDLTRIDSTTHRSVYVHQMNNKPVLKGTELATVPESAFLTPRIARTLLKKPLASARSLLETLSDEACLALAVLHERHQVNPPSPYAALISTLPTPRHVHAVPLWNDDELAFLQGSPVLSKAERIRHAIRDEFDEILSQLSTGGVDDTNGWLSLHEYAWALAVVDSRCVSVTKDEPLVLSPLVHLCDTAVQVAPTARVEFTGGVFTKKKLALLTEQKIESADIPLTLAHAAIASNADALLERGEAIDKAQAHAVEVSFEIVPLDPFFDDKCDILEGISMQLAPIFYLETADDKGKWEPPEDLDAFLRLLCLSGADAFLLEAVFRRDVATFMQSPVSKENEQAVCNLMIAACDDAIDAYALADTDGDQGSDQGDATTMLRKRLAAVVVRGEIDILKAAKARYERIEQSLDVLEYYAERRLKDLDLLRPLDESEIVDSESGARVGRAFDENFY